MSVEERIITLAVAIFILFPICIAIFTVLVSSIVLNETNPKKVSRLLIEAYKEKWKD